MKRVITAALLGAGLVIGAGACVPTHVPPTAPWGGNPSTQPPSFGVQPTPKPSPSCANPRNCWG